MHFAVSGSLIIMAAHLMSGEAQEFIGEWEYPWEDAKAANGNSGLDKTTISAIKTLDEQVKSSNEKTIKTDAKKFLAAESQKRFRKAVEQVMEESKKTGETSEKTKFEHRKISAAVGKLNDIYKRLESEDRDVKIQAIAELVASIGDAIPGPAGTLIMTIANLAATAYGSKTESANAAVVRQVKNEIKKQYATSIRDDANAEIQFIETEILTFEKHSTTAYAKYGECKDGKTDGEVTDEPKEECLDSAISEEDKKFLREYLADQKWRQSKLSAIKLVLSDQIDKTGDFEHMKQLHDLIELYVRLKTLRFALHEQIENFLTVYIKELTYPIIGFDTFNEQEGIRYDTWIDLHFNQSTTKKSAILALYLIYKPIPGMKAAVDTTLEPMRNLIEQSQTKPLTWRGMGLDNEGYLQTCASLRPTGAAQGVAGVGAGVMAALQWRCNQPSVYLEAKNASKLSEGVRIRFAKDDDTFNVAINPEDRYLQKLKTADSTSFFVLAPVGDKWIMMPTYQTQSEKSKFFTLVELAKCSWCTRATYPYVYEKDFNNFEIEKEKLVYNFQ